MKLYRVLSKHLIFILLALYVLITRLPYLFEGVIPFSFDHGKDSLAIMHMLLAKSPAFIGPWTSIPGLFFGPGWYYLLAPAYLLGGFNPVSAVVVMVLLLVAQVYLAHKYFGLFPALIMASAPSWLMITTSAWNPFPMTFVTLVILIILKHVRESRVMSLKQALILGLAIGMGFHFSAAYAIFYPFAVAVALNYLKPKFSLREVLGFFAGVFIPFIPQLLFELRHDFVQTKAVIAYFQQGEPHAISIKKILSVIQTTFSEFTNAFLPEIRIFSSSFNKIYKVLLLLSLGGIAFFRLKNDKAKNQNIRYLLVLFLGFVIIPIFGFFFLHFNVWYVYPMMPVVVLLIGKLLELTPKWYQVMFAVLLIITPVVSYLDFVQEDRELLTGYRGFLPVKERALALIREKADGRPFASYHYVPDVYDFSYQYLYFTEAYHGKALPTEFSYKPAAPSYVVQKTELLEKFAQDGRDPELVFYIVEKPENPDFLDSWWGQQQFSEIIESIDISDEVKLYVALP